MKLMTVLGNRPEIIRLSRIIPKLDEGCDHILLHTGPAFEPLLSDIFFRDMIIRKPDVFLGIRAPSYLSYTSALFPLLENQIIQHKPDRIFILGNGQSSIASFVGVVHDIPVYHAGAGDRTYIDSPEEKHRKLIDLSCDFHLPYTLNSDNNLRKEGFAVASRKIVGNPIFEVLLHYFNKIDSSRILEYLDLSPRDYIVVTLNDEAAVINAIPLFKYMHIAFHKRIIVCVPPQVEEAIRLRGYKTVDDGVYFMSPIGFFDFMRLLRTAACVLTDSTFVQEECAILRIKNLLLKGASERPEMLCNGCSRLVALDSSIYAEIERLLAHKADWTPPVEYINHNTSDRIVESLLDE